MEIPDNNICPRCHKNRGSNPQQWTIVEGFIGCKYCFIKWMPDKEERKRWLRAAKRLTKTKTKKNDINMVLDELLEVKAMLRQLLERQEVEDFDTMSPPNLDTPGEAIAEWARRRLNTNAYSYERQPGRLTVGKEFSKLFGKRLPKLIENGSLNLISDVKNYVLPLPCRQAWVEPPESLIERLTALTPEEHREDVQLFWQGYRPCRFAHELWNELGQPEFTTEDNNYYGW